MGDMYSGIDGALETEEFVKPFRSSEAISEKMPTKALW
jgi:hypothetical protein